MERGLHQKAEKSDRYRIVFGRTDRIIELHLAVERLKLDVISNHDHVVWRRRRSFLHNENWFIVLLNDNHRGAKLVAELSRNVLAVLVILLLILVEIYDFIRPIRG